MQTSKPTHLTRIFLAGLLAALPLIATAALLLFVGQLIVSWLGPGSVLGRFLGNLGLGVADAPWVGYLLGLAVVVALVMALGLLVERGLQRWFHSVVDGLIRRIPGVRTVYDAVRRIVEMVARRDDSALAAMQPVWVQFGGDTGEGGISVLALLSSAEPVQVQGRACLPVIVPTAPIPIGGGLLYVPVARVSRADIGMDALTSLYVSMGMSSSQHLPSARPGP
jgi:uncharacterized membrane protein